VGPSSRYSAERLTCSAVAIWSIVTSRRLFSRSAARDRARASRARGRAPPARTGPSLDGGDRQQRQVSVRRCQRRRRAHRLVVGRARPVDAAQASARIPVLLTAGLRCRAAMLAYATAVRGALTTISLMRPTHPTASSGSVAAGHRDKIPATNDAGCTVMLLCTSGLRGWPGARDALVHAGRVQRLTSCSVLPRPDHLAGDGVAEMMR
jgi:hypothetical protein